MINENKKLKRSVIIGVIAVIIISSIVVFLSSTTYLSCYVMSFGVVEGYKDQLFNTLNPIQQSLINEGDAEMKDPNPSFAFIQNAGYEYCLSYAPGLPDSINVEFE